MHITLINVWFIKLYKYANVLVKYTAKYPFLRILTGKKHRQIKLQRLEMYEYGRLGCWYIKSIIYKRFLNWNKTFKKLK